MDGSHHSINAVDEGQTIRSTTNHCSHARIAGMVTRHGFSRGFIHVLPTISNWGDAALDGWWRAQQEAYWSTWQQKNQANIGPWFLLKTLECILGHVGSLKQSFAQYTAIDSQINDHVRTLFGHSLQAVPHDAFAFFQRPLDKLLQQPRHYKEQWVASVESVMQRE